MLRIQSKALKPIHILEKNQFDELNEIADSIAWKHMLLRFLLNVILIFLMVSTSSRELYFGLIGIWIVYATQFHFWGSAGIGHELLHRRVFSSRALNDTLYNICSSLTWNNAAMFRDTHMLHHRDTFSSKDVEANSVQNWDIVSVFEYLLIDVRTMFRRIYYVMINSIGYYPNLENLSYEYIQSARVTLALNIALYSSFYFLFDDLTVTALLFISPFSCSLLNKILAKAQHHELSEYRDEGALRFSRTLVLPKFLSFLYANMNYHAEHHFAPSVPYYNLVKLHKILKAKGLISSQSFYSFVTCEFRTVWSDLSKTKKVNT